MTEQTKTESGSFNQSYILLVSITAALGGLLFGFDTAIISGSISFIHNYFNLNSYTEGWAVSSILIGCAIGAGIAGKLSDKFGRKKVLLLCALLFALTGIGTGLSTELFMFVSFRILGGIAVGAAAMVAPMYIAETVPASWRGKLVSIYQLAIVTGILLAYLAGYLLSDIGDNNWRWMFASQALPSVLFFASLFLVPETPRWLVKKGRNDDARKILVKIGGAEHADEEIKDIQESLAHPFGKGVQELSFSDESPSPREGAGGWANLFLPRFRHIMWTGIVIAVFQQITGINAILYYAPEIIKKTGINIQDALMQTIGIGVAMFLFTLVAIRLIDKAGRRLLLLWGCLVMAVSLVGVAVCFQYQYFGSYIVLLFMMLYIAGFSASLGAVTWVILSEIFPNSIRGMALSFCTLILWLADFVVSFIFPVMNENFSVPVTLLIFAILCIIYFVYILFKVPETKGKTLEQLEKMLTREA